MRNLTLTRNKSFVGCLMKDQVYIRDEYAPEVTIAGEPCRKLGTLKNGETKTFQISEGEQKIFLIADKISKNYCNGAVTVPAGDGDAAYSGQHRFSLGSNPFVFEGVELTDQEKARQKKNKRTGIVVFIAAIIVGFFVGGLISEAIFAEEEAKPKTFNKGDFSITLTDAFETTQSDGAYTAYKTNAVLVRAIREEDESLESVTLAQYADMVLLANGCVGQKLNKEDGYLWFCFTDKVEDQEITHLVACYVGREACWVVEFATPTTNYEKMESEIIQWANSVDVGTPLPADTI